MIIQRLGIYCHYYDYSVRDRGMFCHRRGLDSVDVHLTPRASQVDSLNAATPPTIL